MSLGNDLKELGVTAELWAKANKAHKGSILHELLLLNPFEFNKITRAERKALIIDYFDRVAKAEGAKEKADYIKTVYRFKSGKVLHCGLYEEISGGILNNIHTAMKWKFPNTTIEETEAILKTIK